MCWQSAGMFLTYEAELEIFLFLSVSFYRSLSQIVAIFKHKQSPETNTRTENTVQ
jgi:hypothetical protein